MFVPLRPGGDGDAFAVLEEQGVVIGICRGKAFAEAVARQVCRQGFGGEIAGLGLVDGGFGGRVFVADGAEAVFAIVGVGAVVLPVVPDGERHFVGDVGEPLAGEEFALAFGGRGGAEGQEVAPFAGEDRDILAAWGIFGDEAAELAVVIGHGLRIRIAVGVHGDGRPVVEDTGLEAGLEEWPVELGERRPDEDLLGHRFAEGLTDGDGEFGVIVGLGRGLPELPAIGLVPVLPDNASAGEVLRGRDGPAGIGLPAFVGMRGEAVVIELAAIGENGQDANAVRIGRLHELIVFREVVDTFLLFAGAPGFVPEEVHADPFDAGGGKHLHLAGLGAGEMDVDADAIGNGVAGEPGGGVEEGGEGE